MKLNEAQVAGFIYVLILFIVFGGRIVEFNPERQPNCTAGWTVIRDQFVLGATANHVSMAKNGLMRRENVLGKIQPCGRYNEAAFMLKRATQLCAENLPSST